MKRPARNLKWWLFAAYLGIKHPIIVLIRIQYEIKKALSDILAGFGFYNYRHKVIFLAGMPMSGTTWVKTLLGQIPGFYTRKMKTPYEINYRQDISEETFSNLPQHGCTLYKTHMNPKPENLKILSENNIEKAIITYRDLRDIVVSRYYRLLDAPKPEDAPNKVDYIALGKEKALDDSIEAVGKSYVSWIKNWKTLAEEHPEKYLLIKYEDIKKDTKKIFRQILDFYEFKLEDSQIDRFLANSKGKGKFKNNNEAAMILPFALSSNFRSGKSGHWKEELTESQIEKCKEYMGDILIELGYEKNLDWK
jgi:hypothetical protein